jgi:hypothetical protein
LLSPPDILVSIAITPPNPIGPPPRSLSPNVFQIIDQRAALAIRDLSAVCFAYSDGQRMKLIEELCATRFGFGRERVAGKSDK